MGKDGHLSETRTRQGKERQLMLRHSSLIAVRELETRLIEDSSAAEFLDRKATMFSTPKYAVLRVYADL